MADTYTEFLNLTKPEVGGSRDSWGVKQNDNLGKLDAWAKALDATVKANTTLANAAMPKAGGIFTGQIYSKTADGNTPQIILTKAGADDQQWGFLNFGGDGALYLQYLKGGVYQDNFASFTRTGDLWLKKLNGNVSDAIAAAAKAGNDALAKAVAKTGDSMSGNLTLSGNLPGNVSPGVRFYSDKAGADWLIRAIPGNRIQFCDGAATVEYMSIGAGGDIATRQLGDINTWAERRMGEHQNAAANRCVTQVRWVMAGHKGYNDQPGTGGFISPFGGHAMNCDYWSWRFAAADGQVGSAPFAGRWRALQVYIANNGDWVTIGAAS